MWGTAHDPFPAVMGSHALSFYSLETMDYAAKTRCEYMSKIIPSSCGEARDTMHSHVSSCSLPSEGSFTKNHIPA